MKSSSLAILALGLLCLLLSGCESPIASALDEGAANEVVAALHVKGVGARKEGASSDFKVMVANDDVGDASAILRAENLPRKAAKGFAVFDEGGLVPTPVEERARYTAALCGELNESIKRLSDVLDARVHLALPERREFLLEGEQPVARASVLVRHRANHAPDLASIQSLVSGAVQNMKPEHVAVVMQPSEAQEAVGRTLVQLGPIAVSKGSSTILKALLGGSLVLHLLMGLGVVFLLTRRRATPNIEEHRTEA